MDGNAFLGNVFFAFVGAAMAALGIVKCRFHGWTWLLCAAAGVAVLMAMLWDWGKLTYMDCLLWFLCIVNFGFWFALKSCRESWWSVIPLVPIVSALLVVVWTPWWWFGVVGGMAANAVYGYWVNKYNKFKSDLLCFEDDDF